MNEVWIKTNKDSAWARVGFSRAVTDHQSWGNINKQKKKTDSKMNLLEGHEKICFMTRMKMWEMLKESKEECHISMWRTIQSKRINGDGRRKSVQPSAALSGRRRCPHIANVSLEGHHINMKTSKRKSFNPAIQREPKNSAEKQRETWHTDHRHLCPPFVFMLRHLHCPACFLSWLYSFSLIHSLS